MSSSSSKPCLVQNPSRLRHHHQKIAPPCRSWKQPLKASTFSEYSPLAFLFSGPNLMSWIATNLIRASWLRFEGKKNLEFLPSDFKATVQVFALSTERANSLAYADDGSS
ncbi:actin-binding protein anillin-like protein [Corchorus olitorius]|uniref:Actin-binding protein anillin-like protein n=1 Tax=Corchorus olitorius TaxID=93759 RepID=A0A1R3KJX0_9ROSI|nr:actin-binding protein anillin-like protein [Corchorus olitorius]